MTCALVNALNLGTQCSEEHIGLIRAWFKVEIPKMAGYADALFRNIQSPNALESIFYNMTLGASWQSNWEIIRVAKDGNHVNIDARGFSSVREEAFGTFRYITEYEITQDSVKVISHKEIPAKRKD